jgi:hypothetical protein
MNRKRTGFSLVLSLAIMAGMVMMVIVLAAFLQVETRLALGHSGYMRARLNAIASAKMALGQLQQLAGPDQRVTMRADMYDAGKTPGAQSSTTVSTSENPSAPTGGKLSHQKRYWTGVWATGGVDSSKVRDWDVMNPHKSRLFLGWLSSPCYISASAPYDTAEYLTKPLPNYLPNRSYFTPKTQSDGVYRNELTNLAGNDGQVLIDDLANDIPGNSANLVPLLSRGSVKFPSVANNSRGALEYYGQVDALPVPLPGPNSTVSSGINGQYAFWIGDEGIKAKANLPDAYAAVKPDGTGYTTPLEDWDDGFRGSAAQRNAIEVIAGTDLKDSSVFPGGFNWGTWRTSDVGTSSSWNATKMARVTDTNSLILWANTVGGPAAGDAMKDASKALFHDVTALSYSTITDTYNGGIKLDLSTAFELPYTTFRGLEMSYGQKKSSVVIGASDRVPALFHNATNRSRPATVGGSGGNAADNIIDLNRPNYASTFSYAQPTNNDLLKFSPRSPEWAATYVGAAVGGGRYGNLKTQNGEEPERVGFIYEVPLRSAFWNGDVYRINPITSDISGAESPKLDSDNLNARIERGPTWDLYRNYYRSYKMEIEQCHKTSAIRGQDNSNFEYDLGNGLTVFARGIEPLTNSTFQNKAAYNYIGALPPGYLSKDYKETWPVGPIGWNDFINSNDPNYISRGKMSFYNNYSTASNGGPQYRIHAADWQGTTTEKNPIIPWPTSMKVAPSIIRFAFMYSTVWKNINGKDVLGVAIDPFIVVHNPYDSPIEFPGIALITSEKEVTHLFQFFLNGKQIGDVFTGQTYHQARQFSFRAIAGENGNGKIFRLEPGEIQVITATSTDTYPSAETELSGYNAVEITGQFKKKIDLTKTCMFFPMDPFALNMSMSTTLVIPTLTNPVTLPQYPVIKDPTTGVIGLQDIALLPAVTIQTAPTNPNMTTTPKSLINGVVGTLKPGSTDINAPMADWDGKDFSKLKNAGNLTIKIINYSGTNFGPSSSKGYYIFGERRYRGSGHIVDGGSQKISFHMQYSTDYNGNKLSPTRRWVGPIYEPAKWKDFITQTAPNEYPQIILNPTVKSDIYKSLTIGTQSIVQLYGIDEPLLLSFRSQSSGWPAYGNAANSYPAGKEDPEYKGTPVVGFLQKYSQSLTLTDGGAEKSVPPTSIKNPFFIHDFFVRGSAECTMDNYDVLPNDSSVSDNRMVTPPELRTAPMSPFAVSTRAQLASFYSYDGKSHAPVGWVESQRNVNAWDALIPYNFNSVAGGSWGNSALSKTNSKVILFSLPRRPILSLAQLGSASTSQDSANPDLSIGSSFAHPGIKDLSKVCDWPGTKGGGTWDKVNDLSIPEHGYAVKVESGGDTVFDPVTGTESGTAKSVRGRTAVRTDVAFASNLALWDSYWFSGLNTQEPSYSDTATNWPNGANLPTHTVVKGLQTKGLDAVKAVDNKNVAIDIKTMSGIKTALENGYNPLANKRVTYIPDVSKAPDTLTNIIFPNYLSFPHPSYLGRHSLYNGGFNVNSTSKAAWKAVLGAMKNQKMPDGNIATGTALTRFARAFGTNDGSNKPWECYHDITDKQLDDLAAAVVNEVRRRGPFMSLSDFVNRRLVNDDNFGLKGAIQAAIDSTDINGSTEIGNSGGTFSNYRQTVEGGNQTLSPPYFPVKPNDRFPSARAMSKTNSDKDIIAGQGAPGIISQMDVLNSVGPNLTARSDTFVIRAYGEAFDNNGQSIGKAWVEVVTQRSSDFVALTDQQAQSLNISAEPNVRAPAYRDNNKDASKSDYDAKPIVDMYQRNTSTDTTKNQLINLNRVLGRRFKTVGVKWLNPQDI